MRPPPRNESGAQVATPESALEHSLDDTKFTLAGDVQQRRAAIVERRISEAPGSSQKLLARAFCGAASPRAAIKAMCLQCTGFDREAVRNCTGWSCCLWEYRPFQDAG